MLLRQVACPLSGVKYIIGPPGIGWMPGPWALAQIPPQVRLGPQLETRSGRIRRRLSYPIRSASCSSRCRSRCATWEATDRFPERTLPRQGRRLARLPALSHRRHRRRSQPLHRSRPRYQNNELLVQPFGATAMMDRCCTRGCPTFIGEKCIGFQFAKIVNSSTSLFCHCLTTTLVHGSARL